MKGTDRGEATQDFCINRCLTQSHQAWTEPEQWTPHKAAEETCHMTLKLKLQAIWTSQGTVHVTLKVTPQCQDPAQSRQRQVLTLGTPVPN